MSISKYFWIPLFFVFFKNAYAASGLVFCQQPVTVDRVVSFCGGSRTASVFPNIMGYATVNDDAQVTKVSWASKYVSVHTSLQLISTRGHIAALFAGPNCGQAMIAFCEPTLTLFTGTVTHYTVYAPAGDIATQISRVTATVTKLATLTKSVVSTLLKTATVTKSATVVSTLMRTATVVSTLLKTTTATEVNTATITKLTTVLGTVTSTETTISTVTSPDTNIAQPTVTVTETDGTCGVVATQTVKVFETITESVPYTIGSGDVVTIYTSGVLAGTSTYYSCPT